MLTLHILLFIDEIYMHGGLIFIIIYTLQADVYFEIYRCSQEVGQTGNLKRAHDAMCLCLNT